MQNKRQSKISTGELYDDYERETIIGDGECAGGDEDDTRSVLSKTFSVYSGMSKTKRSKSPRKQK